MPPSGDPPQPAPAGSLAAWRWPGQLIDLAPVGQRTEAPLIAPCRPALWLPGRAGLQCRLSGGSSPLCIPSTILGASPSCHLSAL